MESPGFKVQDVQGLKLKIGFGGSPAHALAWHAASISEAAADLARLRVSAAVVAASASFSLV